MTSQTVEMPVWMGELFTAIDSQDLDRFVGFLTPDAVFRFGSSPPAQGHAEIRAAVGGFFTAIHGLEHVIARHWDSADRPVCEGTVTYTRLDESRIALPFVDVFGMRDGLIQEYLIYMDITPLYAN